MSQPNELWFVTGGCGFIGSNFIRLVMKELPNVGVVNLDALTYAGRTDNLIDVSVVHEGKRYFFCKGDIADAQTVSAVLQGDGSGGIKPNRIINFAAESHVDRSILDAQAFIRSNVSGVQTLLSAAREFGVQRFLQVSTDEVYGDLSPNDPPFHENSPLAPNSPYAASKAAADLLVRAAHKTWGLDAVITRCSNNYGPYQFPEKLIPLMIIRALSDQPLPVYGDGSNVRDWIHVEDHARALLAVMQQGAAGAVYNIGADCELNNLTIVHTLLDLLGKPRELIQFVKDRPGHDRRYAIDSAKIQRELGWAPRIPFGDGLRAAVAWYRIHEPWWMSRLDSDYQNYFKRQYAKRFHV